jgi:hypothetical protein
MNCRKCGSDITEEGYCILCSHLPEDDDRPGVNLTKQKLQKIVSAKEK